jgi:hypothetical protein
VPLADPQELQLRSKTCPIEIRENPFTMKPTMRLACIALAVAFAFTGALDGQTLGHLVLEAAPDAELRQWAAPSYLAESSAVEPLAVLGRAEEVAREQLEAIALWNREGRVPSRTGFVRPLPLPRDVPLDRGLATMPARTRHAGGVVAVEGGELVWAARVTVEGAWRLRLELQEVTLPEGARLLVHGSGEGGAMAFGLELRDAAGSLWTPGVEGETLTLEVSLPGESLEDAASPWGFRLAQVAQEFLLDASGTPVLESSVLDLRGNQCLVDGACYGNGDLPGIAELRKAVAHLRFVKGAGTFSCTGGLLNNRQGDGTPFLLTAAHCFDGQASAHSLEAYFDYHTEGCGSQHRAPGTLAGLPRTNGATLLATGAYQEGRSDFTLVRLTSPPPGQRTYLGFDASPNAAAPGTPLFRLSHPHGWPQHFTRTRVPAQLRYLCSQVQESEFIYHDIEVGGTDGGSSGSPLVKVAGGQLQLVGQLLGGCGPTANSDVCDPVNHEVDGRFAATYPRVQQWLWPAAGGGESCPAGWVTDSQYPNFCFKVEIASGTEIRDGVKMPSCQPETLCFAGAVAGRAEVFVRIVGPRPNGHLWPTLVKFTTSQVDVWIRQRSTGIERYYRLPGAAQGVDELPGLFDRNGFLP